MNRNLFFIFVFSHLLANLTEAKPIKEPKEILENGNHAIMKAIKDLLADLITKSKSKEEPKTEPIEEPKEIMENKNHPIVDSFKIVSTYLRYLKKKIFVDYDFLPCKAVGLDT